MACDTFPSPALLEGIQEALRKRKAVIDFETLGRTLAYSPFLPRVERAFFVRESNLTKTESIPSDSIPKPKVARCLEINPLEFAHNPENHIYQASKLESECERSDGGFEAYVLDLCGMFGRDANPTKSQKLDIQANPLESISLLRRHSVLPIIYADIFVDEYQVLESALFGADALMFPASVSSSKELSHILNFARRVSLESFVYVGDSDELKKAIFSGASMLFIPAHCLDALLPLVPNTQIIASDSVQEYGVDLHIRV